LGLHTASICFSDWQQWGDILGGSWQWGRSWHPPQEFVSLTPSRHPLMEGIAVFDVFDELYSALELRAGIETLLIGNSTGSDVSQPVLWLNRFGNGRIVYDALGHDAAAVYQTDHAHALRRAVCWALNLEDVNV
jgi:type 1 glutamine amidotransferase